MLYKQKTSKTFLLFIVGCLFFNINLQAQMLVSNVDTKQLGYKKVAKYLKKKSKENIVYFSDIRPSVNDSSDFSPFCFHSGSYIVHAPIQQTWNTCILESPAKLWNSKMLGLSCVYNANSDTIFYRLSQHFDTLGLNQIYFINLRILRLFNVAAALIITKIDYDQKLIEFTYVEGNKSIGRQILRLVETGESETKIVHDTFYRSNSDFRDKRLYSRFHQIAITGLHKRIDEYSQWLNSSFEKKNMRYKCRRTLETHLSLSE